MAKHALALLIVYYGALGLVTTYAVHRLHLVKLRRRYTSPARESLDRWLALTIQLPLYNEPNVAERLIEAAARLDYPSKLDIQVLDDSTDETRSMDPAPAPGGATHRRCGDLRSVRGVR